MPVLGQRRRHIGMGAGKAVHLQGKAAARLGGVGFDLGRLRRLPHGHEQLPGAEHQAGEVGGVRIALQEFAQEPGVSGGAHAVAPEALAVQALHLREAATQAGGHREIAQGLQAQGHGGILQGGDGVGGAVTRRIGQAQHLGGQGRILADEIRNLVEGDVVVIQTQQQSSADFRHDGQVAMPTEEPFRARVHRHDRPWRVVRGD